MPTIYLETSVVSYFTAPPSRDLIVAGHQQITHEWWSKVRPKVQCHISEFVNQEAGQGNQEAAQKRLAALKGVPILMLNEEITELARKYFEVTKIPEKSRTDAYHLAFPVWYKVDYLLTWNCKHIANGVTRKIIETINKQLNFHTPTICTPEELMEV